MELRQIIRIDEEKCTGCGQCIIDCAEGALQIIDGKARLIGEVLCDGLGACLGGCPEGALTIEEREADAFDEEVVNRHLATMKQETTTPCGCPGSAMRTIQASAPSSSDQVQSHQDSGLSSWPVQLMLVPPNAPFLKQADLLISADCVPFAMPDFHSRFLAGRALLVGCPKLDDLGFYREKLQEIFHQSSPKSITVLRMEVPCCTGLAHIVQEARDAVIPDTPLDIHIVEIEGGRIRA
ncbi:ATP-binding protein [Candidatus Bipolaricaulota bacterium]